MKTSTKRHAAFKGHFKRSGEKSIRTKIVTLKHLWTTENPSGRYTWHNLRAV